MDKEVVVLIHNGISLSCGTYHNGIIYNGIKRNAFESVLMRWMNLEAIIQSEVSQIQQNKHCILTHMYGI